MLTPSVSNTVVNLIIVSVLLTHGAAHDPTTTSQSASLIDIKNTLKVLRLECQRSFRGAANHANRFRRRGHRRKREAQAQAQTETVVTVMLVCLIILLGVLVLVF
jgi:hypothetical protein